VAQAGVVGRLGLREGRDVMCVVQTQSLSRSPAGEQRQGVIGQVAPGAVPAVRFLPTR
jgi:hypothetical protein